MKKVVIAHGWSGSPDEPMLKWLGNSLRSRGFEVIAPTMPNPDEPTIQEWVACLNESVGAVNEDTYFIGHSVGCQTVLRYLEQLPPEAKVGGVVLIAPWFWLTLENLDEEEDPAIAKPWIETPIDFTKVISHTQKFTGIFSDNDPYVPLLQNETLLKEQLHAHTIVLHDRGHFAPYNNVTELPEALGVLEKIIG